MLIFGLVNLCSLIDLNEHAEKDFIESNKIYLLSL